MTTYAPKLYLSPISLPDASRGGVTVRHKGLPAGEEVVVVSMREALLSGRAPAVAKLVHPLVVTELHEEAYGCWMTDHPQELNQIADMLAKIKPHGDVLVGGLGLGVLAKTLTTLPAVRSVTVVERNPDIIALCASDGYRVVEADIGTYLKATETRFDFYLLDTWQANSEGTWFEEVLPLRRAIRNKWGKVPTIHGWMEGAMQSQVLRALMTYTQPHWWYQHLPIPMGPGRAREFVRDVGLPRWEAKYGRIIDETREEITLSRATL
jgi:hypothetical protein